MHRISLRLAFARKEWKGSAEKTMYVLEEMPQGQAFQAC
jgi:hypothetical protein